MSGKAECLLATGEDKKSNMTVSFNKTELCHSIYTKKCIRNWTLPIEAFQDQCKQTMITKYLNKRNKVKNTSWWEADQLSIHKRSREGELGAIVNNI